MESSFGKWEGLTDHEVAERYPGVMESANV